MKITHIFAPESLVRFEQEGYRIQALPPFRKFRGLDIPWDDLDALQQETEFVAKLGRSRMVIKLCAGHFGLPVEVYVKRYNFKTWLKYLLRAGRKTRAREEFDLGWKLIGRGIRTPRPVWMAEALGTVSRYSMLATEALPAAESAGELWQRMSDGQRMHLMTALGQFTWRMHEAGFYHDDFKSAHVLLLPNRPVEAEQFYVVDLLGCRFPSVMSRLTRSRNLYQMIRSFIPPHRNKGFVKEHRMEFLRAYCGSRIEAHAWSKWVDRIGRLKGQRI